MKERPILFTHVMAKANHDGIKDMTRRLKGLEEINETPDDYRFKGMYYRDISAKKMNALSATFEKKNGFLIDVNCPYGAPDDILWMRETWAINDWGEVAYKADGTEFTDGDGGIWIPKFKSPLHMPRTLCRLRFRITEIRVERLQHISEADVEREGIIAFTRSIIDHDRLSNKWCRDSVIVAQQRGDPRPFTATKLGAFKTLIEKINGEGSWAKNPFCWVITYKKI